MPSHLIIKTIVVTPFQQNARVLIDTSTKKAVIVDPGGDVDNIIQACDGYDISSIFVTHSHIDHVGGLTDLLDNSLNTPLIYAHSKGKPIRETIEMQCQMYGFPPGSFKNAPEPNHYLDDMHTFSVGSIQGKLLYTPGHAPGHVCLFFDNIDYVLNDESLPPELSDTSQPDEHSDTRQPAEHSDTNQSGEGISLNRGSVLIAGDTLFRESVGRTDLPLCNHADLITSIKGSLFTLPDETIVLPGHGPSTSIKYEKYNNPFVN